MGTRPNPFREHGDPDTARRPLLGVGDGVEPHPCRVLPLQGWDRINVGSMMAGLALSGPFSPGGGATAPNMGSPPRGGDNHGPAGMELMPHWL